MNEMSKFTQKTTTKSIALEALGWLAAIKEAQEAPAPERDANYCQVLLQVL
jgi:hypothetical protein